MLPILPLIIGAAAGAAATQLVRTKAVQQGLKKAGSQIRQAGGTLKQKASDGLDTVRETSAEMRRKVADKLHRRATHPDDADSAYEDASALLLPAPHEEAPAPKKASRSATGTRRRAARSASTSQTGGASPKSNRRTTTAREASEETPAPRRRPRKRPQTAKTEHASATPSTSKADDDAGQH